MSDRNRALARSNLTDVLIHLHIRKTGGTSLNSAIKRAFCRHEVFELYAEGDCEHTALDIASLEGVSKMLIGFGLGRVRYITGHIPYGVHRLFGDRAKYFTLVRDPIERVISTFFWFRTGRPFCRSGKPLPFEEYVESRADIYLNNYQVRVLSGSPELDEDIGPRSGPRELIFGPPVERRHLEQAKHNIAEHFLLAAPLERFMESTLILRMMYGWPMRLLQNERKHETPNRPRIGDLSSRVIEIIEDCNRYDAELYQWIKCRFAAQRAMFEPQLSEELRHFRRINGILNSFGKHLPHKIRKRLAEVFLYRRGRGSRNGPCQTSNT
jgi:hypothetical protein